MLNPSLKKYNNLKNNGYVQLATFNSENNNWKNFWFNDLQQANQFIRENKNTNSYSSVATYKAPNYIAENNINILNEYFVDIDNHINPLTENQARELVKSLEPLFDVSIPIPSLINYTGRGIQIHFNLKGARDIAKWKYTEQALLERFKAICYKEDVLLNVYGLEIDKAVKNATRVLRNAYTINTKVNKECKPVFTSNNTYSQEEIIECFNLTYTTGKGKSLKEHQLKELNQLNRGEILKATNSQLKAFKQFNKEYTTETLNKGKQQDLLKLIQIRNIKGISEGYRSNLLSVFVQLVRETTNDIDVLYNEVSYANEMFNQPLNDSEVKAWCKSACSRNYIFTNKYIINKLNITEQEQEQLGVIISRKVKNRRYYCKNKEWLQELGNNRYKPIKMLNKANKLVLKARAKELTKQGVKQKEIAKELNVSTRTIRRYINK